LKNIYYRERIFGVVLRLNGYELKTKGLLDTGNKLREKTSGKQVTVVEKEVLKQFADVHIDKIYIIPYRSIGKENGVIYGIRVDELVITHEKFEKVTSDAIIGIYDGKLSGNNRYNAILHSECLM
jgi:stage II sporulation protein GA (sporulation sigma-E factor processing peptidase)